MSKFKINEERTHCHDPDNDILPFFPKYDTELLWKDTVRITWFEMDFSQSRYNHRNCPNGSNACTIIAILVAAKCYYNDVQIYGPEKTLNYQVIHALAHGMLEGNSVHDSLKSKGVLSNINLTVPEAIKYAGRRVSGLTEWKSTLHMEPIVDSLYKNLKSNWIEWLNTSYSAHHPDLYVVLICDARSVLFVIQESPDTVTLIDSHQHSPNKGAFIAVAKRPRMKLLCHWFGDTIYRYYQSCPDLYELSFLYFRNTYQSIQK